MLTTTGEHEYTRYGFRKLIANRSVDVLQPDAYKKQLLAAIVGDELADSKERTEAEQLRCPRW